MYAVPTCMLMVIALYAKGNYNFALPLKKSYEFLLKNSGSFGVQKYVRIT